eukprot:m.101145 g.101145  ORF g.101145 m.101145 type:complete len:247 (-) comp27306_c0_seq1:407-1147(-)
MAGFFKKKRSSKIGTELIPKSALDCLDDVASMENSARQLQQTLKKYIYCQKDEVSKLRKFLLMVEQQVDENDYSTDVTSFVNIERHYTQMLEATSSDPLKSYCKIFPKLNSASSALVRAAQDQGKAEEKHSKKRDDIKAKIQLEKAKVDLEQQLNTVPPAMADVLIKTKEHLFLSLSATLQSQVIYFKDSQDFITNTEWSQIPKNVKSEKTTDEFVEETEKMIEEMSAISIVGKMKRQSSQTVLSP